MYGMGGQLEVPVGYDEDRSSKLIRVKALKDRVQKVIQQ